MFRSRAASVKLAEVTKVRRSSTTTAFAWRLALTSGSSERGSKNTFGCLLPGQYRQNARAQRLVMSLSSQHPAGHPDDHREENPAQAQRQGGPQAVQNEVEHGLAQPDGSAEVGGRRQPWKGLSKDEARGTYETTLQKMSIEFRTQGTRWDSIRHLADTPFFVDSRASRVIQPADHVAYAVFRQYHAGDTQYFDRISSKFDAEGGVVHGLVHKEHDCRDCMCIACFSRRQRA